MTWFRVDDTLAAHQKVRKAGVPAMGLWVLAGAHSSQQLLDGFVPEWFVVGFPGGRKHAERLVGAGLWSSATVGGENGWLFHDWQQANPTREQVMADREKAKARQQKWREQHRTDGVTDDVTDAVSNGVTDGVSNAAPTRPDPTLKKSSTSGRGKRATAVPDIFPITDAMNEWGRQNCPAVLDPQAETRQFLDHHRAKGSTFRDWTAAWRTWMGNAQKYATARPAQQRRELAPKDAWLENM